MNGATNKTVDQIILIQLSQSEGMYMCVYLPRTASRLSYIMFLTSTEIDFECHVTNIISKRFFKVEIKKVGEKHFIKTS